MTQTDKKLRFKTIKKIDKTLESIRHNTSWVKDSQLKNKLYKQFIELADEMVNTLQYIFDHRGLDVQLAVDTQLRFEKELSKFRLNLSQKTNLVNYFNNSRINNLKLV